MIRIFLTNFLIDSVRDDDEIGIGELVQIVDLALEAHLRAEIARAVLQDVEQRHARAAAEAVASRAYHLPFVDHVDVAPVGETPADALVGDQVVGLERVERLVGEHHAEAEGVVGAVALVDRDLPARPGFLREEREVQAAGPRQDFQDIFQRLAELPGKRSIEPFALAAPADLAADENQAALAGNPVGEALRPRPARRLQDLHRHCLSLKRCSLPVSVRGKASTNSTTRGYLYGAMLFFT